MKRPLLLWLLLFGLLFLGFGGLYGGISMLVDPSGMLLGMDVVLPQLGVPNYILPGLFLISVMGIFPLFLIYALLAKPDWPFLSGITNWNKMHWAWTATGLIALVLFIWLFIQGLLIGFIWPIQYITGFNGAFLLLMLILPPIRAYYNQF
jgi:hypothetical protein